MVKDKKKQPVDTSHRLFCFNVAIMKYPNLRYGNPNELAYYAQAMPLPVLAQLLRRDVRTIKDYLSGKTKVPWWVPELLRLLQMERQERMRQMNFAATRLQFGIVTGQIITFKPASAVYTTLDFKHHQAPFRVEPPLEQTDPARKHARTG